jgi:hypothetical protein
MEAAEDFLVRLPPAKLVASLADSRLSEGGTAFYSSHGTDVMFLVARSSSHLRVTLSAGLYGSPIKPLMAFRPLASRHRPTESTHTNAPNLAARLAM